MREGFKRPHCDLYILRPFAGCDFVRLSAPSIKQPQYTFPSSNSLFLRGDLFIFRKVRQTMQLKLLPLVVFSLLFASDATATGSLGDAPVISDNPTDNV